MRKESTRGWRQAVAKGTFWTEAEAREALAECDRSGETVAGFARRRGLGARRLYWWRHELKKKSRKGLPGVVAPLIPVTVRSAGPQWGVSEGVVVVEGELRVEIGNTAQVSPEWVAEVLRLSRESRE